MEYTEELLLKDTNPKEYSELIKFNPRWGEAQYSKETLPSNSTELGM